MIHALGRAIAATAGATAAELPFTLTAGRYYRLTATDGSIWYRVTSFGGSAAAASGVGSTQLLEGEGALVKASGSSNRVSVIRDGGSDVAVELVAFGYGVKRADAVPQTTLTVAIADSADPVVASGAALAYTIDVENTGDNDADNVTVAIELDSSLTYVSGSGTGWTVTEDSGSVLATRSTLAVGAAPQLTINVTTGAAGTATTQAGAYADNAPLVSDSETTTVVTPTTLTVAIADSADPVDAVGTAFSYAVDVTNTGSSDASDVEATVTLDASLTFVSASGTGWTCTEDAGVVTCTRSSLAVGAAPTITVNVTSGSAGTASTDAEVSAFNASLVSDTEETTVEAVSTTLTVALTDSADPVITGADAFSYTASVENTGGSTATSVELTVTLDASLTYVSASGTGWSCNAVGQVVTCTLASLAAGATADPVTINVTTGDTGVTASTSASVEASNTAAPGTDTETTAVDLVTKDATLGWYLPADSTEFSRLLARKSVSVPVPDAIWNFQEASGNPADANGTFDLTAAGTLAYQQTVAGITRKAINFTDATSGTLTSTNAALPNIASESQFTCLVAKLPKPAAVRGVMSQGTTSDSMSVTNAGFVRTTSSTSATGAVDVSGTWEMLGLRTNRTAGSCTGFTDTEKLTPTFSTSVTGEKVTIGAGSPPAMSVAYGFQWHAANAEISDANYKALLQAMGVTVTWS